MLVLSSFGKKAPPPFLPLTLVFGFLLHYLFSDIDLFPHLIILFGKTACTLTEAFSFYFGCYVISSKKGGGTLDNNRVTKW